MIHCHYFNIVPVCRHEPVSLSLSLTHVLCLQLSFQRLPLPPSSSSPPSLIAVNNLLLKKKLLVNVTDVQLTNNAKSYINYLNLTITIDNLILHSLTPNFLKKKWCRTFFNKKTFFRFFFFLKELFLFVFSCFMNRSFDQWTIRLIGLSVKPSEINLQIVEKSKLDTKVTH